MRILLTNDDGIEAKGIRTLYDHACALGEVSVVAPERERSASGHGITVHKPLRARPRGENQFAVSGTPADCVKLALEALLPQQPDLVISGINLGANLGTDVLYSGTVSAAIEGIMMGVPSIAVSLTTFAEDAEFSEAAAMVVKLCRSIKLEEFPRNTLFNVNIPAQDAKALKGVRVTTLGLRRYVNSVEERKDPRGQSYYWLAGEPEDIAVDENSDISAVKDGFVSVTPVHFDLTNYRIFEQIRHWQLDKHLNEH